MIKVINYADASFKNAQKYNSLTAKKVGKADLVVEYGPESIDDEFRNKNAAFFVVGDGQIGKYGLWRPLIIKEAYSGLKENDFLMYVDSGTYFINDVHYLTDFMESKGLDILVFELPLVEKYWTKRDVFLAFDADVKSITDSNQRLSTAFIIRKSKIGDEFVERYYESAINMPELFSDEENKLGVENYKGFVQNRHNQSVLSVLSKTMNIEAYRDISEYGHRPQLYSYGSIPKYTFHYKKHETSTYPQIIIQHRRGKVAAKVKIMGWIRSKAPSFICKIMIKGQNWMLAVKQNQVR